MDLGDFGKGLANYIYFRNDLNPDFWFNRTIEQRYQYILNTCLDISYTLALNLINIDTDEKFEKLLEQINS
jgi:hypothetical protein